MARVAAAAERSPTASPAPVSASPETLFKALTETDGLASFWTSDSHAEPVVGSVSRFGFPSGSKVELRVDELVPGRRVVWTMLSDTLHGPKWTGTRVTWEMTPVEGGLTEVLFKQTNWPPGLVEGDWHKALAGVTFAWAGVLRALKGYAETGSPQPHFTTVPRS